MSRLRLFAILFLLIGHSLLRANPAKIESFELQDVGDQLVRIAADESKLTVVCFLGTECPLANLYAGRLMKLADEFRTVRFLGVNSNRQDSPSEVAAYAKRHKIEFPVLKDVRNLVADQFDAKRTPEVFVLDEHFSVRYRGRIDDQYLPGVIKPKAKRQDLRIAIEELLAGQPVSSPTTEAVGCFIGRMKQPDESSPVTYCKQIARILQQNCVECHRKGEIGPFQLEDYDEVVGWADTIIEVIDDGRMPPWHASPDHGEFTNARHISAEDKSLLRSWVDAGMPYGNEKELPPPVEHTEGWRLPHEPDLVISMSGTPFDVPGDGTIEYQYFVVDPGFKEDKWITGAQIVPGNSSIVHHSIVFIRPPDGARFRGLGWLTAYVPGNRSGIFPEASAIFVPAKSKFVFQQHYTPNGSEQSDITKVAMTFGKDEDILDEIYTLVGIDQELEIPPGTANFKVKARVYSLPPHAELLAVMPHMHLRGKSFRLFGELDGRRDVLLDVPNYDFNWQHAYEFVNPWKLSDLDGLEFEMTFDNSEHNPVNPDPSEHVTWGDQTYEEMAVAFFEVKEPRVKPAHAEKDISKRDELTSERQAKIAAEADRILGKFDANKDGLVAKHETPFAFQRVFGQIDQDGDQKLTREEIELAARYRVK